jgi:hypothetical protein
MHTENCSFLADTSLCHRSDSGSRFRMLLKPKRSLRSVLVLGSLLLFSCSMYSRFSRQSIGQNAARQNEAFSRSRQIAEELLKDDRIAWLSTDSILAEKSSLLDSLDRTWFVYKEDNRWFAYYGRYSDTDDTYFPKYAFVSEDGATLEKIPAVAGKTATLYAKAVTAGTNYYKTIVDSLQLDIHYNHYIRKSGDGWFTMWFFPAGYGNYCAQGIETRISIDPSAEKVTGHRVTGTLLRYFELDKKQQTVELDNTYDTIPSLGNIFFLLQNRDHFASIRIINKNSVSTMVRNPDSGEWAWVRKPK